MNKFYIIILQILIIINKIKTNNFHLKLPFKTIYKEINSPTNYFETNFFNEPFTFLTIGTHHQLIPCYLSINTYTLYISGSNSSLIENQPKYEEYKSIKYQNLSNKYNYESTYTYGIPSIDELYLNNDIVTNLKFYLEKSKFSLDELVNSCILGLGYEGTDYNYDFVYENIPSDKFEKIDLFITQMKNNEIIQKKYFL